MSKGRAPTQAEGKMSGANKHLFSKTRRGRIKSILRAMIGADERDERQWGEKKRGWSNLVR